MENYEKVLPTLERALNFLTNDMLKETLMKNANKEYQDICKEIELCILSLKKHSTTDKLDTISNESRAHPETIGRRESIESLTNKISEMRSKSAKELQEGSVIAGYLFKHKKKMMTQWKRRYCIMNDYFLFYFKSENDIKVQGYIILPVYNIQATEKDNAAFCFTLQPKEKKFSTYSFVADTKEEFQQWKNHISSIESMYLSKCHLQLLIEASESIEDKDTDSDSMSVKSLPTSIADVSEDLYEFIPNTSDNFIVSSLLPSPPPELLVSGSPDFVEESLYECIPADIKTADDNLFSAKSIYLAIYDSKGEDARELSFNRGDVIYMLEKIDNDWGLGYSNDKVGLVPNNCIARAFES